MKIELNQERVDRGERFKFASCPVAIAMSEEFGVQVFVLSDVYLIAEEEPGVGRQLPKEAIRFIRAFDCGLPVEPTAFDVERPDYLDLVTDGATHATQSQTPPADP